MAAAPALDLDCDRHVLPNGLRVLLHRDPALPLVALNLWVHVGSKNERPGKTGFAHLFEHMLFQGSAHVGTNDHFRRVQEVGGVANGSTWYDRTNYYETLPAHCLELGLWLESDRFGFLLPAMTQEKLDTQREVVRNERLERVDNQPYGRALERLAELLYPEGHPYRWPVIGSMGDLAAASLADLESFFRTYYAPNNTVLSLAGDFESAAALEAVARYFGELPRGPQPPALPSPPPTLFGARRDVLPDRILLPRVYLAHRAPRYGDPAWYAGSLLAATLAGGKASRLYQDLVYRRELAQEVVLYLYPTELEAMFLGVATARPGVGPEELERALTEHLEQAARTEVGEDELERARARLFTSFFEELEPLDQRADLLSQYETYFGDPGHLRHELEAYAALAAPDLRAFAERFLVGSDRAVLHVVPGAR